jgi:hypothetical protein
MHSLLSLLSLLGDVTITPDPGGLPGSPALQKIVNGTAWMAGLGLSIALLAGAVFWALGHHSGNYRAAEGGKMAMITALVGAVIVGGAAGIINFFLHAGAGI